jgi:predicted Fe-Mo cluster-binding NifX family protein
MRQEFIEAVIISVLGSGAFATLVTALINAFSGRKTKLKQMGEQLTKIENRLIKSEKDALRTQLLIMISDYPDEKQEIMTIAQHYFGNLKGDWYATSLFNRWITEQGIAEPSWFDSKK